MYGLRRNTDTQLFKTASTSTENSVYPIYKPPDPSRMKTESKLEDKGFLSQSEFELVMRRQLELYIQVRWSKSS